MDSHANVSTGKKSRKGASRAPIILLLLSLVMATLLALTSCGKSENGTYYLYDKGQVDRSDYIKLDGGKWSSSEDFDGTYKRNGDRVLFYIPEMSEEEAVYTATLSDGVLRIKMMGDETIYLLNGEIPKNFTDSSKDEDGGVSVTEKVTVTYRANGGTFEDGETFTQTVGKGSVLTAPTAPTRRNYTFAGWAKRQNGSELWQFASDKATEDITLYAVWKQESAVIISVEGATMKDNREIYIFVPHETEMLSLAQKVVCSGDSVWKLYYDRLGQTEIPTKVAAGMSGELADGNNTFYIVASTQDGTQSNLYTLTVYRSYEVSIWYSVFGDLKKTDKVYTGYEYTVNYPLEVDGYRFVGWKDEKGALTTRFTPMGNVRLTAALEPLRYTVTLDADGGTCNTKKTTVTFAGEYAFPVPQKEGHTFVGWYDGDQRLTDEKGKSLAPWSIAKNTQVVAKYTANQNTVNIISNERICAVSGAGIYAYGTKVTVSVTPYLGGTFLGWYRGETKLSEELQYTFTMGDEKVALQAKMQLAEGLKDLEFEATETTLTITGIHSGVTEITIPTCVTEIRNDAFSDCTWLTSVTIPNGVTNIWSHAFSGCTGLTSITIPSSVQNIRDYAFYGCTNLKNVTFAENIQCSNIESFAFSGCTGLTSITIPNSVVSIGNSAFSGCTGLTSMTLPFVGAAKDGTGKTHFGYIFGASTDSYSKSYVPSSLKTVVITGGTSIGERAFRDCTGLISITIPESVTSIGPYAFSDCTGLTSITIPESVTSIGFCAFSNCTGLAGVYITSLAKWCAIDFESSDANPLRYAHSLYLDGTLATELKIPDNVTSIGKNAFYYCTGLSSITISPSVQSIEGNAFYRCSSLKIVTFTENSQCSNIGWAAFAECTELARITIPDKVIKIDSYAFYGCAGLTSITIPPSVQNIERVAFYDCTNLKRFAPYPQSF